ncbi:MAG: hypothetical protein H8E34_10880 [Bacteroidetes bacterium]|nr:hypothetical protein [Bacteroidota bacterium]
MKKQTEQVSISPPNFKVREFKIEGIAPLVINRFSQKAKEIMIETQIAGSTAKGKKKREAKDFDALYEGSRYVSPEGWDGFNATSIRNACIRACSLVGYAMTKAKLSIFVVEDGWDKQEPQIPLIRIYGKSVKQIDPAPVANGNMDLRVRAAYHKWHAIIKIRWDADQFTLSDVTNLLMRSGMQVGIGEGRPNSKSSCGMNWGLFKLADKV